MLARLVPIPDSRQQAAADCSQPAAVCGVSALGLIAGAWHGTPSSLKGSIFSGMALFVKTYETELVDQTFIKRLSAVDPDEIIRRGKVDFSTNKAALRFARVILSKYNGHQRGGRKLPYRFKG